MADNMADERRDQLLKFYALLDKLEESIGGARRLADCSGRMDWPTRGVYFFREPGEYRADTGGGPRIVRIGTHALMTGSGTKLWTRLSQHKGHHASGGGNHRGSIFRRIAGAALIKRDRLIFASWGCGNTAKSDVRKSEHALERAVSNFIGTMSFLWLAVEDEPGPQSLRGYIERNSIALLSNYKKVPLDPPSASWLGRHCENERLRESGQRVRNSGLWNSNHVDETYDPPFLGEVERLISAIDHAL
jgi:hypothetical protein